MRLRRKAQGQEGGLAPALRCSYRQDPALPRSVLYRLSNISGMATATTAVGRSQQALSAAECGAMPWSG